MRRAQQQGANANNDEHAMLGPIKELERQEEALAVAKEREAAATKMDLLALEAENRQREETLERVDHAVTVQKEKRKKIRVKPLNLVERRPWGR